MLARKRSLRLSFGSVFLFSALAFSGCAVRASYRVYDPYRADYHVWGPGEEGYYSQWMVETHRPHREFRHLKHEEQRQYWEWRHNHRDRH